MRPVQSSEPPFLGSQDSTAEMRSIDPYYPHSPNVYRPRQHQTSRIHCPSKRPGPLTDEANAPHRPQQDAPEGHQRGLNPSHSPYPSNACKSSSSGLKCLIPAIMPDTAHHEINAHSKRRLKGCGYIAETFTRLQGQHYSKREGLGQDIRFFSGKIS